MKLNILKVVFLIVVFFVISYIIQSEEKLDIKERYGIIIHGGAGDILRDEMSEEEESNYHKVMHEAIMVANKILENNGSSLDAVEKAINVMEDSPLFNAGKGAVFTSNGKNELDASIMDGRTLNCGSVAGVKHIKNPISLARLVMERTPHVLLIGEGAEQFAVEQGIGLVGEDYFFTEKRWKSYQKIKEQEEKKRKEKKVSDKFDLDREGMVYGTVGACALDKEGNLAAGTSTGGMTYKRSGRVGDSPIIGAGTYAKNNTCAISATGHGEYFIKNVVAYDISALIEYKGFSLVEATEAVMKKLTEQGATGGVIAIDASGKISMPFNTTAMFRGYSINGDKPVIKIFK